MFKVFFLVISYLNDSAFGAVFLNAEQLARSHVFAGDSRFQSVGAVRQITASGSDAWGSGVLISPEWVLTAGHVALDDAGAAETSLSFNIGLDGNKPSFTTRATVHAIHPRYIANGANFPQIGDLALLKLAEPITFVVPAERFRGVDPPLGFGNPRQQYFMAGYGAPGIVIPGENGSTRDYVKDGLKRAGSNIGSSQGRPTDYDGIFTTFNDYGPYDPNIDLEWFGSRGDSGGGMFMDVNGHFQLAGTITGGSNNFIAGSARSVMIRTTLFNEWIDSQITAVPEPSSLALVGLTVIAGFLIRNRSNRLMDRSTRSRYAAWVTSSLYTRSS